MAASDRGTMWSSAHSLRRIFMRALGTVHVCSWQSISSQRTCQTSPRRLAGQDKELQGTGGDPFVGGAADARLSVTFLLQLFVDCCWYL